jgi:autoinducer 2-degrading protein|tara:strand:- start:64 stop:417 length:354 start_codon:yes stop_codon:yes gene_type:complete
MVSGKRHQTVREGPAVSQFAIFVTIKLKPGNADAFRALILENAEAAVRDEEACQQFQVLNDESDPDTFFFYEVYSDAAGLDAHRETPHYQKYNNGSQDMIAERNIQRCTLDAVNQKG